MLAVLGVDHPSPHLLRQLEAPAAGPVIEPYPDVRHVLDQLRLWGIRMSVVSDTWAGLETMFADLGIEHYFRRLRDLRGHRLLQAGPADVCRRESAGRSRATGMPVRRR